MQFSVVAVLALDGGNRHYYALFPQYEFALKAVKNYVQALQNIRRIR
jgi:hypothetical protein